MPAIRQLISERINVTLLFALSRYRQVAEAYIAGIKDRIDKGQPVKKSTSVASFFLSRIDAVIDPKETEFVDLGGEQAHFATKIRGQVAISSAKVACKIYQELFESEDFAKLKTLEAYRDHGEPVSLLKENVEQASWVLSELSEVGIDFNEITNKSSNLHYDNVRDNGS